MKKHERLRKILLDIRDLASSRQYGEWEEHGDEFRKIVEMCDDGIDWPDPCQIDTFMSGVCLRNTRGCQLKHAAAVSP